jgi:preprotein translocase subunit SecG
LKKEVIKMDIAFGVILLVLSVALTVLVLFQSGKDKKLSGTIAGGAETFFGKSKANDYSKALTIATAAVSAVFTVTVLVAFLMLG